MMLLEGDAGLRNSSYKVFSGNIAVLDAVTGAPVMPFRISGTVFAP